MSTFSFYRLLYATLTHYLFVSAVENAQEERERNDKTAHEMRKLINDIKLSENELHSVKSELLRVRDDYDSEKVKLRQMHLEKLSAERKAAETMAAKNRIAIESDNYKFRADTAELDVQRLQRTVTEMEALVEDLKRKRAESDKQRTMLLQRMNKLSTENDSSGREKVREEYNVLEREFHGVQQHNKTLNLELSNLQKSYKQVKATNTELMDAMESLRSEIADLKQEREFFRRDISQMESSRAEKQIQELRKDLAVTAEQWQSSEDVRTQKEEAISDLQYKLSRERDQVALLKAQIRLLEDRVSVTSQELSIFRSLDIYQKSMAAALTQSSRRNESSSLYRTVEPSPVRSDFRSEQESSRRNKTSTGHSSGDSLERKKWDASVSQKSAYLSYDSDESESIEKPKTSSQQHTAYDDGDLDGLGPSLQLADISLSESTAHYDKHSPIHGENNSHEMPFKSSTRLDTSNNSSKVSKGKSGQDMRFDSMQTSHRESEERSTSQRQQQHSSSTSRSSRYNINYQRPSKADFDRAKRLLSR